MHPSRSERAALCDLLERLGPDAPTCCAGWTTRHLAAHLWARDRRPDVLPGLVGRGRFARWTERVETAVARRRRYGDLVDDIGRGPRPWSPGGLIATGDLHEFVVHHEDVRRANGEGPRTDADPLQDPVWEILRRMWARVLTRRLEVGVELVAGDRRHTARPAEDGEAPVTLTGTPIELLLLLFGRDEVADVTIGGTDDAVDAFRSGRVGL